MSFSKTMVKKKMHAQKMRENSWRGCPEKSSVFHHGGREVVTLLYFQEPENVINIHDLVHHFIMLFLAFDPSEAQQEP